MERGGQTDKETTAESKYTVFNLQEIQGLNLFEATEWGQENVSQASRQENNVRGYVERMKRNKNIIGVKMHFLWRTMGNAPLTIFLALILRQRGIPPLGIGVIFTVIRTASTIIGGLLITLVDVLKAHCFLFLLCNFATPLALSGIYWTPYVITEVCLVSEGNSTLSCDNAANYPLYQYSEKKFDVPKYLNRTSTKINEKEDFSNDTIQVFRNQSHNGIQETLYDMEKAEDENGDMDGSNDFVNDEMQTQRRTAHITVPQLMRSSGFWFIALCTFVANTSSFISSSLTESICFRLLGRDGHLYGLQRLYGTIAWGFSALITGSLIDLYSIGLPARDYFPAFVLVLIFSSLDMLAVAQIKLDPEEKQQRVTAKEFVRVTFDERNVLFFLTVAALSTGSSILGTFQLLLVEEVSDSWNTNFPALKTLQGLIIAVQCFGGEIPVFFYSGKMIVNIGITRSFVLVIFGHALRYMLYYPITNPWVFLPIELLHGINYGLFKSVLIHHANELAPSGTTATMLAALKAVQYGGSAAAGVIGGFLWSWVGGHGTFLVTGLFLVLYVVFFVTTRTMMKQYCYS